MYHFRIYRIQMTDYIRRLVTHPVLDSLHYRSISYYNIINNVKDYCDVFNFCYERAFLYKNVI